MYDSGTTSLDQDTATEMLLGPTQDVWSQDPFASVLAAADAACEVIDLDWVDWVLAA